MANNSPSIMELTNDELYMYHSGMKLPKIFHNLSKVQDFQFANAF